MSIKGKIAVIAIWMVVAMSGLAAACKSGGGGGGGGSGPVCENCDVGK